MAYTEAEKIELWDSWANSITLEDAELAEEVVRSIISKENAGQQGSNSIE